jgi:hypothetical protein
VTGLTTLLARVAADGLTLQARGDALSISPADRLTPELRALLLQSKADLLELLRVHGSSLLTLFADPPTWPPYRGRSGPLPEDWRYAVGNSVRLVDGREGRLRALEYLTRSGRLRCCVELEDGKRLLLDPEDLAPTVARRTA